MAAGDYMTGMIFIFVSRFTAGNMHCKIKQREEEHCRDSKYLLKTGLHALKSEAMKERSTACVSLWYIYSSTIAHKVSLMWISVSYLCRTSPVTGNRRGFTGAAILTWRSFFVDAFFLSLFFEVIYWPPV